MHTIFMKILILEASDASCSNQTIQAMSASANITRYCGNDTTPHCDTSVIQKQENKGNQKKRKRSTESLTEFTSSDINVNILIWLRGAKSLHFSRILQNLKLDTSDKIKVKKTIN